MEIIDVINFVKENVNSAFFYTPDIFENAESFFLKSPKIILAADSKPGIDDVLAKVDKFSQDENLIGIGIIPYEIGYHFLPKEIRRSSFQKNNELSFLFYDRSEVEIIKSDELKFSNIENQFIDKNKLKNYNLNITEDDYIAAVKQIKQHIAFGNTYQINYTAKIKFPFDTDLTKYFLSSVFNQSAEYTALINSDDNFILSFSPELFFETDYKFVKSKPMKGTLQRGSKNEEDDLLIEFLQKDEKNIAENVMILDLLRNDIGRISEIDSVVVPKMFEVEKYETLLQMTSTVQGKLLNPSLSNIIKNLFPCGSITGAPKIRSMQIIADLEKETRGIYTGSIGLITNKKAVFNIAIRTLSVSKNNSEAEFGLGSGIVWDSTTEDEYEEVMLKGKFLTDPKKYFELLESILFENGKYYLLDLHLQRLQDAARYFLFKFDRDKIHSSLTELSNSLYQNKNYKIRLLLNKWGGIKITSAELFNSKAKIKVLLIQRKNIKEKQFYNFKTTYRPWDSIYKIAKEKGYGDVLFYNEDEEFLEFAVGNIFFKMADKFYTPPLHLSILNGCYRQHIISEKGVIEKEMKISDIKFADEILICNSVRKEIIVDEIYDTNGNLVYLKQNN